MVTPVVDQRWSELTLDASCLCKIADNLRDGIFAEIGIDRRGPVSTSLTEFKLGIKSFLVFFLGDHLLIVHLAEDRSHTSLCISSACLSQRIVERRALRKACDESALGKCEFGCILVEIVHCRSLNAYVVIAHRRKVDIELQDLVLGKVLLELHSREPFLYLTGCGVLVLTAYELDRLLSDRGTTVSSRTAVYDCWNERWTDTLDIDTVVFTETLILGSNDRVVQVSIFDITVGDVNPVDILSTCELCDDFILAVINERSLRSFGRWSKVADGKGLCRRCVA